MESWREELYKDELYHYGIFGQRKGKGKKYGYRSSSRNAQGRQERAEKENIHGNGRGMEDQKLLGAPKSVEYKKGSDTYYDAPYTDNSATKKANSSEASNQNASNTSGANNQNTSNASGTNNQNTSNSSGANNQNTSNASGTNNQNASNASGTNNQNAANTSKPKDDPAKVIQKNTAAVGANNTVKNLNSSIKTIITGIDDKRIANLPDADLSGFSNEDLEAMTKRANLETNYRKATAPTESKAAKGAKAVTDIMTGLVGAGLAAMAITKVYKMLSD